MTVTRIKSFKEIPIQRNTLVLCDIDDTVIVFEGLGKKWWRERFDDYYERNGDYEFSEKAVLILFNITSPETTRHHSENRCALHQ
jgi:hypothetical protein